MVKKASILFVVFIALALMISACQPAPEPAPEEPVVEEPVAEEPCTVKVGIPTILTGWGAPMGQDIKAGAEFAASHINSEGGVLGCEIELVFADVKGESAEDCALAAAVMDREDVAVFIPGAYFGTTCIEEFGRRDPVLMHGSASVDMVSVVLDNLPESKNVFMMCEDELIYGPNTATVILDLIGGQLGYEFPNNKVALLGGDITYDMNIQYSLRKAFEAAGWEVVLDDVYAYGNTEFGPQLARIRAEEPAVILGQITSTDSSVAFMNQFLTNPTNSLIYIQWSPASAEFIGLLGEKANGVMWSTEYEILPENKAFFYPMFEAEYGRIPGVWPPNMWDYMHVWVAAVESCGDFTDHDCIVDYYDNLDNHPYDGLTGTFGMDAERKTGRAGDEWIPIQFIQIQDQRNVTIYLGTAAVDGEEFITPPWID